MDQHIVTLCLFALGMLVMIVPIMLLAFFARDSTSAGGH